MYKFEITLFDKDKTYVEIYDAAGATKIEAYMSLLKLLEPLQQTVSVKSLD